MNRHGRPRLLLSVQPHLALHTLTRSVPDTLDLIHQLSLLHADNTLLGRVGELDAARLHIVLGLEPRIVQVSRAISDDLGQDAREVVTTTIDGELAHYTECVRDPLFGEPAPNVHHATAVAVAVFRSSAPWRLEVLSPYAKVVATGRPALSKFRRVCARMRDALSGQPKKVET